MKILFLVSFLMSSFSAYSARICYFSLNHTKEFTEMEKFTKKLNKYSSIPIEVQEFVTTGSDAEESFKKMVASGVQCDGLVISGHHTGSFGGANAKSNLGIDFMEKLSCDPKNEKFFNSIKALWLQGCRTLGVGKIEANESADFHTGRVGNVLDEDNLTQSFADLNNEFSATLDQDNPLSSRYLRVFPRATTFGWTKTAPGVKAGSEFSIPFHIAHLAHLNDDRRIYFDDPIKDLSLESAVMYSSAILDILGTKGPQSSECNIDRDEKKFVEAWKEHGTPNNGNKYFFNNPDLNAYASMFQSNNVLLKRAKEMDCLLKNIKDPEQLLSLVDEILSNDEAIGYNFNSIYELMQRLEKDGDVEALVKLRAKLTASQNLNQFLMRKLASQDLGILRRIDYYAFWKSMTNTPNSQIEKIIQNSYLKMMLTESKADDYAAIDFKFTLTKSLEKHKLLKRDVLKVIANSPKSDATALESVARSAVKLIDQQNNLKISEDIDLLKAIVRSPKSNRHALAFVADAVGIALTKAPVPDASDILKSITKSAEADHYALGTVAFAISISHHPIEGTSDILKTIARSPTASSLTLKDVADTIGNSRYSIEDASDILKLVLESPKSEDSNLVDVEDAIKSSKSQIKDAAEILERISIIKKRKSSKK